MANYWFIYNNTDGSLYSHYLGETDEWTNVPDGYSALMFQDTDVDAQKAFMYPKDYIVQNGQLVNVISDEDRLKRAKATQIQIVLASCNNVQNGLIKSSALGTEYTYVCSATAKTRYDAIYARFHNDDAYIQEDIYTVENGYLTHTKDQFVQFWTDAFNNEKDLDVKYRGYVGQINAIQLSNYANVDDAIADVQKITWE